MKTIEQCFHVVVFSGFCLLERGILRLFLWPSSSELYTSAAIVHFEASGNVTFLFGQKKKLLKYSTKCEFERQVLSKCKDLDHYISKFKIRVRCARNRCRQRLRQ